jgi:hypothetical protein
MPGNSWVAERLAASQEGLSTMKLVNLETSAVDLACGIGARGRSNNGQRGGILESCYPRHRWDIFLWPHWKILKQILIWDGDLPHQFQKHVCKHGYKARSRNSSVGIATGYGLNCRVLFPGRGKKFVSTPQRPHLFWGPTSLLPDRYRWLFPGG